MNKQEYLNKFAEKLSLTIEEVEAEFKEVYADIVLKLTDLSEDQQEQRALQRLALLYKKQMRSPAIGFEGVIIATSDCVDAIARKKQEAKDLFAADPQMCVESGITDNEGTPLDQKKEWSTGRPNPSYGKPLPEHNYLRNVWGVAKKSKGDEEPKFFTMLISGEKAQDETIPIFKPIRFMAIDKGENKINASTFTQFKVDKLIDASDIKELISKHCIAVPMNNLESYHDSEKEDWNRLCVVEGDVSALNLEPTTFGSRIMNLEDTEASLEDLDAKGVTCWIPERINIDFAEGSKVLVIGRTAQGKKKDDQGNPTDEPGDVSMNVYGVYAIPEFKIEIPEEIKPITEESLDIE